MSDPFIAEIQIFGFSFNPRGWAFCNGATLPLAQNIALFSLISTTYGGNGQTTFQLPNLTSRVPMQQGNGPGLSSHVIGQTGGQTAVTLIPNQMPIHNHSIGAINLTGDNTNPNNSVPGRVVGELPYVNATPNTALSTTISQVGNNQPHENMMPYLAVNFCIALQGIFPSFP